MVLHHREGGAAPDVGEDDGEHREGHEPGGAVQADGVEDRVERAVGVEEGVAGEGGDDLGHDPGPHDAGADRAGHASGCVPHEDRDEHAQDVLPDDGRAEEEGEREQDRGVNDIFVGAKADLEKTIWMLTAEIGQAPGL